MDKKIKEDIEKRGVTRHRYSVLMGVGLGTVYKWLAGEIRPSRQVQKLMQLTTDQLEMLD